MKGIIELDIDGTITAEKHAVSSEVKDYLAKLVQDGWVLIFITGRPFAWGYASLQTFTFPYYLAVQNGAVVLEMPKREVIAKYYLDPSIFPIMDEICHDEPTDFVIYGGYEHQDVCYYRPAHFAPDLLRAVQIRCQLIEEKWIPLDSFDQLPIKAFPSVKCFGKWESVKRIHDKIEVKLGLHNPLIRDPLIEESYVDQITAAHVTKGETMLAFSRQMRAENKPLIAAGDDTNDESMLKAADIKVVMATAPKEILPLADIIAPSAEANGIIEGLNQAVQLLESRGKKANAQ